jgi:hypothetical protein
MVAGLLVKKDFLTTRGQLALTVLEQPEFDCQRFAVKQPP